MSSLVLVRLVCLPANVLLGLVGAPLMGVSVLNSWCRLAGRQGSDLALGARSFPATLLNLLFFYVCRECVVLSSYYWICFVNVLLVGFILPLLCHPSGWTGMFSCVPCLPPYPVSSVHTPPYTSLLHLLSFFFFVSSFSCT